MPIHELPPVPIHELPAQSEGVSLLFCTFCAGQELLTSALVQVICVCMAGTL